MARPWRVCFPDAVYHVSCRGNNREPIFIGDDERRDFLGLLGRAHDRFRVRVMAFCLMTNHYHLFVRTPDPNLPAAMHWLNATYTMRFNRRRNRCGHIFQGRYKTVMVADPSHWLRLSIYLHLNPVRAAMAADPADYEWSSFSDYMSKRPRFDWLDRDPVLAAFGGSAASRKKLYREQCLLIAGDDRWEEFKQALLESERELKRGLGPKARPAGQVRFVPEYRRAVTREIEFEPELSAVAEALGTKAEHMLERGNGALRLLFYYHLVHDRGLSMTIAGQLLGVSVYAVSKGLKRLEGLLESDQELQRLKTRMSNVQGLLPKWF